MCWCSFWRPEWPPLQMEIRLTPSALGAPTKTKNLADDFAAHTATVAAGSPVQCKRRARRRGPSVVGGLLQAGHHVLDDGVVLQRVDAQILAVSGLLEAAVGHLRD